MKQIKQVSPTVVWPIRQVVMYPDKDLESAKLAGDEEALHLALYEDDQVISVISLFAEGDALQFRKFATVSKHQRKGHGSQLLQYVIDYARQNGFSRIWCNARETAAGFYKKFGLMETQDVFQKNGIRYVIMELILPAEKG